MGVTMSTAETETPDDDEDEPVTVVVVGDNATVDVSVVDADDSVTPAG